MLILNNDDVARLIRTSDCIDAIEEAYHDCALGEAAQLPPSGRMDLTAPSPGPELNRRFIWGAMAGVLPRHEIFALRQKYDIHYYEQEAGGGLTLNKHCVEPGTYCGFITLASTRNAEPLAIINDGVFQHVRVAATAAVAARHLARPDSRRLAIIGSGGMARSHAEALLAVRPIETISVYSPTRTNRERFAREVGAQLGIPVTACDSALAAVREADIVAFCTDSLLPVLPDAGWLRPGVHFSCVVPGEVGEAPQRADRIILHLRGGIVEERARASEIGVGKGTAGFTRAGNRLETERPELPILAELVAGQAEGRTSASQITYFHNIPGSGLQFAAVGALLYRAALAAGAGTELPTGILLQNIRN